ncbi:SP_1767 family glycosyltransferase [Elizabethkingia ursingii]|uniref:SP_1767 family glycosyltransferase n=1 Tax=Elizabethkingia ursingii TaxID=1756150 RepID=UPI0020127ABD|nr:SP_1767 family glycosyltransferase [Elizabethkingia ursingii]MCL1665344.1 SP_1767 family glycosyltransferase [Elizabethkingia ursingii]
MNFLRKIYLDFRYYLYKVIYPFPKVYSKEETLERVIKSGKSVARFGDGEFHLISHTEKLGFQDINRDLSNKLLEVLISNNDNCLICIPEGLYTVKRFNAHGRFFWKQFIVFHFKKYLKYFKYDVIYDNSFITRPYMDYSDKTKAGGYFLKLKELWNNKNILIVEGDMSRLGVGNDLFNNTKSISRILTLSKNAFSVYEKLLNKIKEEIVERKFDMVLIALGPTVTVLAYDLSNEGVQAIDIGHIDIEYEWYSMGAFNKVEVPGKHVNEVNFEPNVEDFKNDLYKQQIIAKIT